jgi:opacity protein-like surface antigen
LRPFGLAGVGFTHYTPALGSTSGSESSTRPLFCYGVGLDYHLAPHVGMRLQYRGLVYESPTFGISGPSGSAGTTKEPSIGAFVNF